MKLTNATQVSVDGVMQGNGPSEEDRRAGFERDGWALPLFDAVIEGALGVWLIAGSKVFGETGGEAEGLIGRSGATKNPL